MWINEAIEYFGSIPFTIVAIPGAAFSLVAAGALIAVHRFRPRKEYTEATLIESEAQLPAAPVRPQAWDAR